MKSIKSIRLLIAIASLCMFACSNLAPAEPQSEETPIAESEAEKTVTRVPDLIGLTHEEAQDLLYEADLAEKDVYNYNESFESGIVFETNPAAGTVVDKGSSVSLIISKGPEPTPEPTPEPNKIVFTVPTGLIGLPLDEAIAILEGMGIEVRTSSKDISSLSQEQIDNLPFGTVAEVSPEEGSEYIQLDDGSTYVILYYY